MLNNIIGSAYSVYYPSSAPIIPPGSPAPEVINRFTTTGIDGRVVGATALMTVPADKMFIIMGVILRCASMTGFVSAGSCGIGVNASQDNMMSSTPLMGLTATNKAYVSNINGSIYVAHAGDVISLGIDTAFNATACSLSVDVLGYML